MKTEDILNEREKTHGDFGQYSELRTLIADALVEFMCKHKIKRAKLNDVQLTAINSIISKMCRIFCGDPNFADHWDDIAGYAMLGRGKPKEPYKPTKDDWCEDCVRVGKRCAICDQLDKHAGAPRREQLSEFEKKYCVPFECMNGEIHQWVPCATEKNRYVVNGPAPTECAYCQEEKPIPEESGPYHKDCEQCHHDIKCPCQKHLKEYCDHPFYKREYSALSEVKDNVRTTNYFWICAECDHQHIHDIKQENVVEENECTHPNKETWYGDKIDYDMQARHHRVSAVFSACKDCNWAEKVRE